MPTRQITAIVREIDGVTPLVNAKIRIELINPGADTTGLVIGQDKEFVTDSNGRVVMPLWENNGDYSNTHYTVRVYHPATQKKLLDRVRFQVRDSDAFLHDLIDLSIDQPKNLTEARIAQVLGARAAVESLKAEIETFKNDAVAAEAKAKQWADADQGTEVEPGKHSAKHHATLSGQSAQTAHTHGQNATTKASEAATSATQASGSATAALNSQNAAKLSEDNAADDAAAVAAAKQSIDSTAVEVQANRDASEAAEAGAEAARDASEQHRDEALAFRNTASQKATDATNSANLAEQWANAPEDSPVQPNKFSAFHFYKKVQALHLLVQQNAAAAVGGLAFGGNWDASTGNPPNVPANGSIEFRISVAGTINGEAYEPGDSIIYNPIDEVWFKQDNTDKFTSINGVTSGAVTITFASIGALGATQTAVDAAKLGNQLPAYYLDWNNTTNKPSTFPPSAHTHTPASIGALAAGATAVNSMKFAGKAVDQFFRVDNKPETSDVTGLDDKLASIEAKAVAAAAFALGRK